MINLGKIWEIFITKYPAFLQGVGITLELAFFTVLFGSLLGLTVAIFRHTHFLPLRWLTAPVPASPVPGRAALPLQVYP